MWSLCRSFHLQKLGLDADFVTSIAYVNIPVEEAAGTASGSRELFVVGCNSGVVALFDIPPPDPSELETTDRFVRSDPDGRRICHVVHRHSSDVLAVASIGSLAASGGDDGVVAVFFVDPLPGSVIATLHHPGPVRCVTLWEGPPAWRNIVGEESVVYVLTGCGDGFVRLWRVDVVTKSAFLHSVFAMSIVGVYGEGAVGASIENDRGAPARRTLAHPVYSLALDADERLLFGNERGKLAIVDVTQLTHRFSESADDAELAAIGDRHLFDALVWALSEPSISAECKLVDSVSIDRGFPENGFSKVKPKHVAHVCGGLEIGSVVDHVQAALGAKGDNEPRLRSVVATFPSLHNSQRWPIGAVRPVRTADLVANAHEDGPVFSLCAMRSGRVVSGGADGAVIVWEFSASDRLYRQAHVVTQHADLVKAVYPVRRPDVFMSASHDGTCREWHIFDEPSMVSCQATLFVGVHDNLYHRVEGQRMAVGAVDVFAPARCMFLVGLFESIVRVYAMLPTATCELPPGWFYDGFKSVQLFDPEKERAASEAKEAALRERQQRFDDASGALHEEMARRRAAPGSMEVLPSSSSSSSGHSSRSTSPSHSDS